MNQPMTEMTVTLEEDCHVVRGWVPVHEFSALAARGQPGDILDEQLSSHLNATIVFGQPEACRRYRKKLGIGVQPAADGARGTTESRIIDWLAQGEVGISSRAIAMRMLGRHRKMSVWELSPPRDPNDFRRCHLLIEQVPEIRLRLHEMGEISAVWAHLVKHWDELTQMLLAALADEDKTAPEMYKTMKALGC